MIKISRHWIFQFVKIFIAVAIISWLISSGKLNFKALHRLLSWEFGPWALILILSTLFFASERWRLLLRTQGLDSQPWATMKLSLIGSFFNFAMPGGVGGDVVKAYYFTKDHPGAKVVAVTSVLMDRILGLYSMIMMALVVMFYDLAHVMTIPVLHSLFYVIIILFSGCTLGLALVFSSNIYKRGQLTRLLQKLPLTSKTTKLYESMYRYGHNGKTVLAAIVLSFLSQVCSILFLAMAGGASGISIPLQTYFLVAPLGFMATAIPISPAGVGIGQAAFYLLFNLYIGHETELGPTTITAFQMFSLLISLVGAFYYLQRKDRPHFDDSKEDVATQIHSSN